MASIASPKTNPPSSLLPLHASSSCLQLGYSTTQMPGSSRDNSELHNQGSQGSGEQQTRQQIHIICENSANTTPQDVTETASQFNIESFQTTLYVHPKNWLKICRSNSLPGRFSSAFEVETWITKILEKTEGILRPELKAKIEALRLDGQIFWKFIDEDIVQGFLQEKFDINDAELLDRHIKQSLRNWPISFYP
jgi:hypothetical protein